jgi:hypothetical protein
MKATIVGVITLAERLRSVSSGPSPEADRRKVAEHWALK